MGAVSASYHSGRTSVDVDPRPRVLFLSDHLGYDNGSTHGATRYFRNVLPRLDRERVDLHVCFLRGEHPAAVGLRQAGVRPTFLGRGKWDPRALLDLVRLIRRYEIDIVHAAGVKGIFLGRAAARRTGAAAVVHLHDIQPANLPLMTALRCTSDWSHRVLAVSDAVARFAVDVFGERSERVEVLYNGLNVSEFARPEPSARKRLREQWGVPADAPLAAVTGRLVPIKGHDVLLRAWPGVLERLPGARLIMVGDGPERPRLESLVRDLELDGTVRFVGWRQDIPEVLAAADVVVQPSLAEGLGYSILEAMAAGRPVVASAVGGMTEVVADGRSGLLVPPSDPAALADAVSRVLEDPALAERLVAAGRVRAGEFSNDAHVRRLEELYLEIASQRQDRPPAGGRRLGGLAPAAGDRLHRSP